MCSICGIFSPTGLLADDPRLCAAMSAEMKHRGPDGAGAFADRFCVLHHNRLTVVDPEGGGQPMSCVWEGKRYVLVYNGELYHTDELRAELTGEGATLTTRSDTELLLYAYAIWGEECLRHLTGIFAFAVYCPEDGTLFCARDRLGVKPFFFSRAGKRFLFSSEVKALVRSGAVSSRVDYPGLWQMIFLSPATFPGSGVFADVEELLPGECLRASEGGVIRRIWWQMTPERLTDTPEEMVERTEELLTDAIRSQLSTDVPLCTLLSGGLDSSIVSAVAADAVRNRGSRLSTYSFEYEDNEYAPTLFQPNRDDAYALRMADLIGSDHTVLTAPTNAVADCLGDAVYARDFPGQADVDSSLLWFFRQIRARHTVALSGECADEIFGGYPWYYRPEMLHRDFYPWIHDPLARARLFDPEKLRVGEGFAFLSERYRKEVSSVEMLDSDSEQTRTARIATALSVRYFMSSLLERKDRMSMASGVEVRVPFADHRLVEYVTNVPWEVRFAGECEKSLLRQAMKKWLPPEILYRKKSPYPKTHNPAYEERVYRMLSERLSMPDSPLRALLLPDAVRSLREGGDVTWFGQLMSRPQLFAWLWQMDVWLEKDNVTLDLI